MSKKNVECGTYTELNITQQKNKEKEILSFAATWMSLKDIMLSEISLFSLICLTHGSRDNSNAV